MGPVDPKDRAVLEELAAIRPQDEVPDGWPTRQWEAVARALLALNDRARAEDERDERRAEDERYG